MSLNTNLEHAYLAQAIDLRQLIKSGKPKNNNTTFADEFEAIRKKLFDDGIQLLDDTLRKTGKNLDGEKIPYPLQTTCQLTLALPHPNIQFEDAIKFGLSQLSRLYTEILFTRAEQDHRKINIPDLTSVLLSLKICRSSIPKYRIADHFELKCVNLAFILSAIKSKDGKLKGNSYLLAFKHVFKKKNESIGNIQNEWSVGTAQAGIQVAHEFYKSGKSISTKRWLPTVRMIYKHSLLLGYNRGRPEKVWKMLRQYNEKGRENRYVALGLLEGLYQLCLYNLMESTKPKDAKKKSTNTTTNDSQQQLSFLINGRPWANGIKFYLHFRLPKKKFLTSGGKAWKVRYRALDILLKLWKHNKVNDNTRLLLFKAILVKVTERDTNEHVVALMRCTIRKIGNIEKYRRGTDRFLVDAIEKRKASMISNTKLEEFLTDEHKRNFGSNPGRQPGGQRENSESSSSDDEVDPDGELGATTLLDSTLEGFTDDLEIKRLQKLRKIIAPKQ